MSTRLGRRQHAMLTALVRNGHYPNAWTWHLSNSESLRILESLEARGLVERRLRPPATYVPGEPIASVAADWHLTADGYIEATGAPPRAWPPRCPSSSSLPRCPT